VRLAHVLPTCLTAAAAVVLAAAGPAAAAAHRRADGPPPVKHVFVIVLENEDAATTFGPASPAPYLARTLVSRGAFVPGYYGIGHFSLDNYLAMISGQAPNPVTRADCPVFSEMLPGTPAADGQVVGQGCVYPRSVKTIADQLDGAHLSWKAYMEDMGDDPVRDNGTTCAHPAIGALDPTQRATPTDQYATRHNPFVYFHSIIDRAAYCSARVVPLTALPGDLKQQHRTANLTFITPDLCHDGHDATCADGGPGGLAAANTFLRTWVPRITRSPAYRRDGLLAIVFDEAGSDGSSCCGQVPGPNSPPVAPGAAVPGGGRTGAVLLSKFIRRGTTTTQQYNHYSLLRSIEDLFGLGHLGYAGSPGLRPFGDDIYTRGNHGKR
jgi:phosphatidylinositol-3-phosphatase